jgi:hypothetical protein
MTPDESMTPSHVPRKAPPVSRIAVLIVIGCFSIAVARGQDFQISNSDGLRMSIDKADRDPAIHVIIPGGPAEERSFNILLPEHVTVREHGQTEVKHLYIHRPGLEGKRPKWKRVGNAVGYSEELSGIRFSAQATLEADGILFHYQFENRTDIDYDMAWAVTDPRFRTFFYDPRLERTYVHHTNGFELLAAETPARLTMPLDQWLPARYLAQLTAVIPEQRVQQRDDGITYYYKSRAIDLPMIATLSTDRKWVAASFTRETGNVWSNPELTCQHVDPQVSLPAHQTGYFEVKLVIFQGTLEQAQEKVRQERPRLQASASPR